MVGHPLSRDARSTARSRESGRNRSSSSPGPASCRAGDPSRTGSSSGQTQKPGAGRRPEDLYRHACPVGRRERVAPARGFRDQRKPRGPAHPYCFPCVGTLLTAAPARSARARRGSALPMRVDARSALDASRIRREARPSGRRRTTAHRSSNRLRRSPGCAARAHTGGWPGLSYRPGASTKNIL
jgi:hypothetical protein